MEQVPRHVVFRRSVFRRTNPILTSYLEKADEVCLKKGVAHEPQLLYQACDINKSLEEHGTMKVESW